MNRKSVQLLGAVAAGVAALVFVVRDPVGSAGAVREGWDLIVAGITAVGNALVTFVRHLFHG